MGSFVSVSQASHRQ
nr:unnamed protein product [Callosobruchus analis]